jgi:hypothetical protein
MVVISQPTQRCSTHQDKSPPQPCIFNCISASISRANGPSDQQLFKSSTINITIHLVTSAECSGRINAVLRSPSLGPTKKRLPVPLTYLNSRHVLEYTNKWPCGHPQHVAAHCCAIPSRTCSHNTSSPSCNSGLRSDLLINLFKHAARRHPKITLRSLFALAKLDPRRGSRVPRPWRF